MLCTKTGFYYVPLSKYEILMCAVLSPALCWIVSIITITVFSMLHQQRKVRRATNTGMVEGQEMESTHGAMVRSPSFALCSFRYSQSLPARLPDPLPCWLLSPASSPQLRPILSSFAALSILQAVARASSGYLVCTLADGPLSHDVTQLLFCVEAVYLFLLAQALMLKPVAR